MSEKTYLTISEISSRTKLPPHTIRYWETRALLRPLRLASGHRRYTKADLETINELKDLVLLKGYTLTGAKKFLRSRKKPAAGQAIKSVSGVKAELLEEIRNELSQFIKEL
ncbi:MAG: MerR family transcriptional regulator [Elusimicrobia bacterium]|nr:MerR family transcriptional regulator [Elusimicrobiota bacterium]